MIGFILNYSQQVESLAKKKNELNPTFYGPYQVVKILGPVAYQLKLTPDSKIHPVFHVSLLKKALVHSVTPQPLPSKLAVDLELQVQPASVVEAINSASGTAEELIHCKIFQTLKPRGNEQM